VKFVGDNSGKTFFDSDHASPPSGDGGERRAHRRSRVSPSKNNAARRATALSAHSRDSGVITACGVHCRRRSGLNRAIDHADAVLRMRGSRELSRDRRVFPDADGPIHTLRFVHCPGHQREHGLPGPCFRSAVGDIRGGAHDDSPPVGKCSWYSFHICFRP